MAPGSSSNLKGYKTLSRAHALSRLVPVRESERMIEIDDFARLSQVSVVTLCYYDEMGLFISPRIDFALQASLRA